MRLSVPRRAFLQSLATLMAGSWLSGNGLANAFDSTTGAIMTVRGPVRPEALGFCLPHEHLLSRFGAPPAEPAGYYGAADDRYVPQQAYHLDAGAIADRWIAEFTDGIGGTDVRPGFIKTAVDGGPLSPIDAKLVRAAALTHRTTGLSMAVHTGDNPQAARQQLDILAEEGVSPRAWCWTHAQNLADARLLVEAATQGAWISLDGINTPYYQDGRLQGSDTLDRHLNHLLSLREAGLLDHVLLSHDGSTFPPDPAGKRPMDILSNTFLPLLRARGFAPAEIKQLTVENPARFFTLARRLR